MAVSNILQSTRQLIDLLPNLVSIALTAYVFSKGFSLPCYRLMLANLQEPNGAANGKALPLAPTGLLYHVPSRTEARNARCFRRARKVALYIVEARAGAESFGLEGPLRAV